MFQTRDEAPQIERAVSIALGVLKQAGVARWEGLGHALERWPAHVKLTKEQLEDLQSCSHFLLFIERRTPGGASRNIHISICPVCLRVEVLTGAPRGKCYMKLGCKGSPRKVLEPTVVIVNQDSIGEA